MRSGDLTLYRGTTSKGVASVLLVTAENGSLIYLKQLEREYALRGELDAAWAARPIALTRYNDRTTLVLEDPGGEPLDRLLSDPLDTTIFLRIAIGLTQAIRGVHERGLIHKDVKPANILVDLASGGAWLTGFGLASRLPREHHNPDAPEVIAGTLAYTAPEQSGRMNRSVDARSDLYSLGISFYEMLTGMLPFSAADPLEWVHCHIAGQPTAPDQRVAVPAQLSDVVMKLLSKNAEERYQTAGGVEVDLRQCLAQWESHGRIDPFPLRRQDMSDRLASQAATALENARLYSELRDADVFLTETQRLNLTASIAHEITQPLAAIVTNADSCLIWLTKDPPNLDKARRAAERIVKDGHRAAEFIQSVRAQARRSAPELVLVDLNRLIVDTLELMQAELQRHEVLLETRLLDGLALIKGDHTQLQQVLVNLVMNAIEAISTSRRSARVIRVGTESNENGEVLTIVEDSGSGIDLQVLDRIFDPMFTTKLEGMGLGLSICRSIVEGHGGRLWVTPNPAGGSIFQFSIPDLPLRL